MTNFQSLSVHLVALCLLLSALATPASGQVPGAYPHLVLTNSSGEAVPPPAGPFDSSGVALLAAGSVVDVTLTYQAVSQPNPNVLWGLLLSLEGTSFPTNIIPPPLFTQPPFNFIFGPGLDAMGTGSLLISVPPSLAGAEAFVQGIVLDSSAVSQQKLSNGVRVMTTPPRFNVAFGFARLSPGLNEDGLEGVSSRDIDGDTLNTMMPYGSNEPPPTDADPPGFPPGFIFLPILPNTADAPVNPLARPFTRLTEDLAASTGITEIRVADASFFPPRGEIYIQQANENPYGNKLSAGKNLPNLERATYTGVEVDPATGEHIFTGVRRVLVGSTGSLSYTHVTGELVFGRYTFATSPGARTRSRVSLDATHPETPHVVIPAFTAVLGKQLVTRDQDLYLYEDVQGGMQGFAVHDRLSHSWHIIEDSVVDLSTDRTWDPMVCIAPDGRSMIAFQHVGGGPFNWDSNPDGLFAIRLDGLDWPASGSEVWEVTYELHPEPVATDFTVESREVVMSSVGIIGVDAANYVAFVGLKSKWLRSSVGQNRIADVGYEGFYLREETVVKEYIEVPLVPPGSTKATPSMPRPFITDDFGVTGTGQQVSRFDLAPLLDHENGRMFVAAGAQDSDEDIFLIRDVSIGPDGEALRVIQDISGLGAVGGTGEGKTTILGFEAGGHGIGSRAVLSPDGSQIAWLRQQTSNGDFIMIARVSGADYATVKSVYRAATGPKFREPGAYLDNHIVRAMYFADEDNLVFLMGDGPHSDALGLSIQNFPRFDLFRYTISTDTMVNLTRTSESPNDFDVLGKIRPAGSFLSEDGRFLYILRDGPVSQGKTSLPLDVEVFNLFGVNLQTFAVFDVTGDEFGSGLGVPNLDLPDEQCLTPVETAAVARYTEGHGSQAGVRYFTEHLNGDATLTDELFMVDANNPFIGLEVTADSPGGSHISNIAPSPHSNLVLFARTNDSDPYAATQHAFAVDLNNFLFERDLTQAFQMGGQPFGRVADGSIFFIPPTSGSGEAVVFAAGANVVPGSLGIAQNTSSVYYPLVNVSNPLAEPVPVLIPILSTTLLGANYRIYLLSAGPSANP